MIPTSPRRKNVPAWQRELAAAIRSSAELGARLELDSDTLAARTGGDQGFPVRVPESFLARMRRGDPHDPLLAQVLPDRAEAADVPGYGPDPVGDRAAMAAPGVIHKYHGRVLLTVTGACGVHCRYCFRREFPYAEANPRRGDWSAALDYIAANPEISEVILSGGDPLTLSDAALADLVDRLAAIEHVTTLRLHTRLPVVLPARVDTALLDWLGGTHLASVVVVHANHANEIAGDVERAMRDIRGTGALLLNQAVLLRGVNDSADSLARLSRELFACGVLPYYLHLLDPVRGAAHYAVGEPAARRLLARLAARLPGYLVPRLVREEAGRPGKTAVGFDWDEAASGTADGDGNADAREHGGTTA